MVYGFIKQSQGRINFYSEPGHGTTVKLYLPMADQECEESIPDPAILVDLQGSEVILLVEDNAPVREFCQDPVAPSWVPCAGGCEWSGCIGGSQRAQGNRSSVTDVVMPGGLNGRELAQEHASFTRR